MPGRIYNSSSDEISIDQVKDFLQYLNETKKVSVSFINQVISAVRLLQHDILGKSWEPIRIRRARMDRKLPVVLSKEEVKSMIETTRNLKHRTLLAITYSAGLRISEVIGLKTSDIDSDRKQTRVLGKGNKSRYTLLSENTVDMLHIYWRAYKPVRYLFEGQKNRQPFSRTSINKVFKQTCKRVGIKKRQQLTASGILLQRTFLKTG